MDITYTLRGFKQWLSHDGGGFQATLCANGKNIATVTDGGHGNALEWDATNLPAVIAFGVTYGAPDPTVNCDSEADSAIYRMVDDLGNQKRIKRLCRTMVLFTIPGEDSFRTIKGAYSEQIKLYIMGKYPTATIVNDTAA